MGYEYYLFAVFIAFLVSIVLLLSKHLFSDIKRQNKLLDEKESNLLRLYQTVEEAMAEFDDLVSESKEEIDGAYKKLSSVFEMAAVVPVIQEAPPGDRPAADEDAPAKKSPRSGRKEMEFGQLLENYTGDAGGERSGPMGRREVILDLAAQGKSNAEIARELNITQNEVGLVIDLGHIDNV